MINNLISRIVAAVILGIVLACASHISRGRDLRMGREAYLEKASARFDRTHARPNSLVLTLTVVLFMVGVGFGVYELLAFIGLKILEKINPEEVVA